MTDDFVTLKMLIVSEIAAEREILRVVATGASIPVEVTEADPPSSLADTSGLIARAPYDVVFFDSRMPKLDRQVMLEAIHAAQSRPFGILIGAAEMRTREVLTDGLNVDGVLAKPIAEKEARELIENCCRSRLPRRVLVVDDSSTVRAVIRKVFQASRYKLEAEDAQEGQAAIDRAKQQRFDLVFLDCHMPGIDGFETLAEIKRAQPDTKVVMITGMRDVRIEDRARTEGASDFIYKPFFPKDIDAVLNRVFGLMKARWN